MNADSTLHARRAFLVNAIYCLLCGAPLVFDAAALAEPLGVTSPMVLRGFGVFLIVFGAVLGATARARKFPRGFGMLLTVGDAGYVLASFAFVLIDGHLVSALARTLIVAVAVGVAGLVVAQFVALRRIGGGRYALSHPA